VIRAVEEDPARELTHRFLLFGVRKFHGRTSTR
jgi:hypothetical protein